MMRDRPREQSLSRPRRTIKQDSFGLGDPERVEQLGMLDGKLNHFLDLLDLLVQSSDHFIRRIGDLFNHHESD